MNSNPSGVNQPLNQHPIPEKSLVTVGADAALVAGLTIADADTDIVVIPAPPAGVVRHIGGILEAATSIFTSVVVNIEGAITADLTMQLFSKDSLGRKTPFSDEVVVAFATAPISTLLPLVGFLVPADQGVVLVFSTASAAVDMSVVAGFNDVRNAEVSEISLTAARQPVFAATPVGNTRRVYTTLFGVILPANYDSAPHPVTLTLSNGTIEAPILLPAVVAPAAVVDGSVAGTPLPVTPPGVPINIPAGWTLYANIDADVTDFPCVLRGVSQLVNQSPVRQDQGGAY